MFLVVWGVEIWVSAPLYFLPKTANMQYTSEQLYDILHQNVNTVYETFKSFFGEDMVDLQRIREKRWLMENIKSYLRNYKVPDTAYYEINDYVLNGLKEYCSDDLYGIYIWWPTVTITNENNKSVVIRDLYARVDIQLDGRIPYEQVGFRLNRATYSQEQFLSDYLHSHIRAIPKSDFTTFMLPCLGTGPIKDTINTLKMGYDEVSWMLFCQELSMYVTVESLSGGPWHRLESIGEKTVAHCYTRYRFNNAGSTLYKKVFPLETLKDFTKYYLQHGHLSLSYKNNRYTVGMPYYDFIIDISNAFIDFYNEVLGKEENKIQECFNKELLIKLLAANGKFYKWGSSEGITYNVAAYQDRLVLRFKGREIRTKITKSTQELEGQSTILLNNNVATFILKNILNTINYRYNYVYEKSEGAATVGGSVVYF